MKPTALCALLVALSTACGASTEQESEGEPSEVATSGATSVTTSASAFAGEWIAKDPREPEGVPVRITVDDVAKGPDGEAWGTTLRIVRLDERGPFRDRAPFFSINGARSCSNVDVGGGTSVNICHEAKIAGRVLTHSVRIRERKFLVPVGSSTSTQTLTLTDKGATYRYDIDGNVEEEIELTPER